MPSINVQFLQKLQDDYKKYKIFIETGTYLGETIFEMEPHFEKIYTIEIEKRLYDNVKNRYHGKKINFLLGDSSQLFPSLLQEINQDAIFFLDGHWSCGITGKGDKDCPLIEEIEAIGKHFQHHAILIIDDYRLFGTNTDVDWRDVNKGKIVQILSNRITKLYHLESSHAKDDRLIIHI